MFIAKNWIFHIKKNSKTGFSSIWYFLNRLVNFREIEAVSECVAFLVDFWESFKYNEPKYINLVKELR